MHINFVITIIFSLKIFLKVITLYSFGAISFRTFVKKNSVHIFIKKLSSFSFSIFDFLSYI